MEKEGKLINQKNLNWQNAFPTKNEYLLECTDWIIRVQLMLIDY